MSFVKPLLAGILLIIALVSCQKEESQTIEPSWPINDFFPIELGQQLIYKVTDITIDGPIDLNDTIEYELMEYVESKIDSNETYQTYRLERYTRSNTSMNWRIKNVWQIRQYKQSIHKIEDNIDYIRLLTPAQQYDQWNSNAFNDEGETEAELTNIETIGILNANRKVATVNYIDQFSLIDKHYSSEQYALGIGLISKTIINVDLYFDPETDWQTRIEKGHIYQQEIIELNE
ncbi:MAG: hypothetical protein JXR60_10230 [Bacteroidales bacterium]|nr:hypothetical protein [Bacteroidales bacterium]